MKNEIPALSLSPEGGASMHHSRSQLAQAVLVVSMVVFHSLTSAAQTGAVRARVSQSVDQGKLVALHGTVHPLARPEWDQGMVPDSLPVGRMLLVLQRGPEQETALRQLLDDQQVKSSPSYHKWVTPEQFGKQFGPADTDVRAVTDWLTAQGFEVDRLAAGRTVIEFSGTAGQVNQGLHTEIHKYVVDGKQHWANSGEPQIPAALSPVVAGIVSLNNFPKKPTNHRVGTFSRSKATGEVKPLFTFTDKTGTWYAVGPNDFATIYNVQPLWQAGTDGTGQSIAVVGQTNINIQDVRDFRSLFGLPPNDPQIILNGPDPGIVSDDEGEGDLDAQWAGAVAKNATVKFVVSETTVSTAGIDLSALYIVDNNLAPVMAESYGSCEASLGTGGNAFYNALWEQAAAQGITVVVATGDSGSAGCDGGPSQSAAQGGLAVSGIASTPFNIAMGGTDFNNVTNPAQYWNTVNSTPAQASAKSYIPETTWNESCAQSGQLGGCKSVSSDGSDLVAASGGPSNCASSTGTGACVGGYSKPSWQSGPGVPSDGARDIPDISLFASSGQNGSFYVTCQADANQDPASSCNLISPFQDFQGVGGTSAPTPAFAGIIALVNQKTGQRQGNANYVLYPLAAQNGSSCTSNAAAAVSSACTFYDVVVGNDSVACQAGSPNCSNTSSNGYGVMVNPGNTASPAWTTTAGYDRATGLGSVNVANLVKNWSSVSFTPTATTLNLSPTSITHGQAANVTISVSSSSGTPTGPVSLLGGANNKPLGIDFFELSNGTVGGTTLFLPGGTYGVTAHYAGDGTFGASDSTPPVQVTVNPEGSQTFLTLVTFDAGGNSTSGATTTPYGSPYALRVDITNSSGRNCYSGSGAISYPCPTGQVTLSAKGQPLPNQGASSPSNYTLNSQGHLEDDFIQFPAGAYTVAANYKGDGSYQSSASSVAMTIIQAATTTTLSAQPTGANTTLTALVNTQSNGAAPTGTVRFLNGGIPISGMVTYTGMAGSSTANASLQATLATAFSAAARVTAQYIGDNNYVTSTSPPVTVNGSPVLPIISGILPSSGSTLGNTRVYISGSNFVNGATVTIGSAAATNVQVVNPALIIATVGPSSAGTVNVTVTNPGAQPVMLSGDYTYRVLTAPTVASTALRIPYVVDSIFFRSNLGINNPNPSPANVQISHLDSNGLLVSPPASVSISPNGYLQMNNVLRTFQGSPAITGLEGSLVLESDEAIQAFVSEIDNQTGDPSILDGIREGVNHLILQSAANTGPFRSTLLVLNLSSNQALVEITALGRDTGRPIGTPLQSLAIAANGYLSFDNILQALSIPDSYGPVEIRSINGATLAAISQVSGINARTSGFFTAQAEDSGSRSEIVPFVIDTEAFRTNLGLNNLSTSNANIQISLIATDGTPLASTASPVQVTPLGLVQINNIVRFLINGSSSSNLTNQQGYLQITSDQPIKAFATQIDNVSQDPSIEDSASSGGSHLLLKSSANSNFQSSLVIVNPSDSTVTLTLNSRQGETASNGNITGTESINIAARGYLVSNNILQDLRATSVFGPIEILSTSGSPLIAVSRVYSTSSHTSGFFNLEPLP